MADLISDLGTYIAANSSFTLGTDLYLDSLPLDTVTAISVQRVGGEPNNVDVDMHVSFVRILSRHSSSRRTAFTNCQTVANLFRDATSNRGAKINFDIGDYYINGSFLRTSEPRLVLDKQRAKVYEQFIELHYRTD